MNSPLSGCSYKKSRNGSDRMDRSGLKRRKLFIPIIILIILAAGMALYSAVRTLYPLDYREMIEEYSARYDLDPYLVAAIIRVESSFRPGAVSRKNARGLMQISEGTGKWAADKLDLKRYSAETLFDPDTNIRIGCWYLSTLYNEFGDTELVLAAYNGGSGNVTQWLKNSKYSRDGSSLDIIPFKETENYLKKVKASYDIYKMLYENEF